MNQSYYPNPNKNQTLNLQNHNQFGATQDPKQLTRPLVIRSLLNGVIQNKINKSSPQHLKRRGGEESFLVPKTDRESVDSHPESEDQDIYNTSGLLVKGENLDEADEKETVVIQDWGNELHNN